MSFKSIVITIFFVKLHGRGTSKRPTTRSSRQAVSSLAPVYLRWKFHTVPFYCWTSSRKARNTLFIAFGLTAPGTERKSNVDSKRNTNVDSKRTTTYPTKTPLTFHRSHPHTDDRVEKNPSSHHSVFERPRKAKHDFRSNIQIFAFLYNVYYVLHLLCTALLYQ